MKSATFPHIVQLLFVLSIAGCGESRKNENTEKPNTQSYSIKDFLQGEMDTNFVHPDSHQTITYTKAYDRGDSIEGQTVKRCGTIDNGPDSALRKRTFNFLTVELPDTVFIPIVYHVIHLDSGIGYLSKSEVQEQHKILNKLFGESKIQFTMDSISYTQSNRFYYAGLDSEKYEQPASIDMKKALAIDPSRFLNVYINYPDSASGYATLPWDNLNEDELDGVVIANYSLPGNSPVYGQGKTLVHEVGHYLGLFHVFDEDGKDCFDADDVCDTPPQKIETKGCPKNKDSCPGDGKNDDIHNYMDYSNDSCMNHFTTGQINRMYWAIFTHRHNFITYNSINLNDVRIGVTKCP